MTIPTPQTSGSAHIPTSSSAQVPTSVSGSGSGSASAAPVQADSSKSCLRWYKTVNKYQSKVGHPYEIQAMRLQDPKEKRRRYEDVKFWPFVGALRPNSKPIDNPDWCWEEYENTVALCTEGKLVVARCTQQDPWTVLWELTMDDHPYSIAWTFHPITMHPIIALAGHGALIYLIDAMTKKCLRTLRGHGDDILCLTFHPFHPHILASTSNDKTTRIWNILGSDAPTLPTGDLPNENFPMGDAEEGNVALAILAGEGSGGHRAYVASAAFHPSKRAIATCGLDYTVKIWPLPPFPPITAVPEPTPKNYRPEIVSFPIFSTNRLYKDFVDYVEWLSDEVLISRSAYETVTWQWLGYRRYFQPDSTGTPHDHVPVYDYTNSSSFMVISRFPNAVALWGQNIGFHRPFKPHKSERTRFESNPNLVSDPLFALCAHRRLPFLPEISLWNPLLAEDDAPPDPTMEERFVPEDDESKSSPANGKKRARPNAEEEEEDDLVSLTTADTDEAYTPPTPASMQTPPNAPRIERTSPKRNGVPLPHNSTDATDKEKEKSKIKRNASLEPWRICAEKSWDKFSRGYKHLGLDRQASIIANVAISPRGAEWIVGVGVGLSVFVWKAKGAKV